MQSMRDLLRGRRGDDEDDAAAEAVQQQRQSSVRAQSSAGVPQHGGDLFASFGQGYAVSQTQGEEGGGLGSFEVVDLQQAPPLSQGTPATRRRRGPFDLMDQSSPGVDPPQVGLGAVAAATPEQGGVPQRGGAPAAPPQAPAHQLAAPAPAPPVQPPPPPGGVQAHGNVAAAGPPVGTGTPGVGLARAIAANGPHDTQMEKDELEWQRDVAGDNAKNKEFQAAILQALDLRVFAMMTKGGVHIDLVHSPAKFFIPGVVPNLRNKTVAFVGDRTREQAPLPVILQAEIPWKWVTGNCIMSEVAFAAFYGQEAFAESLWNPTDRTGEEATTCPRMLLLPSAAVAFCAAAPRTPYELWKWVSERTTATGAEVSAEDYKLVRKWCIMASQSKDGDSMLAFSPEPALSGHPAFHKWARARLNNTLGEVPPAAPAGGGGGAPAAVGQATLLGTLATAVAKLSDVVGARQVQAPAPAPSSQAKQSPGILSDPYQVAYLCGLSGVPYMDQLSPVWAAWDRTKNINSHATELYKIMKDWARTNNVDIDVSVCFGKATMEDLVAMRFNPSDSVARYRSATKGVTPLACRPKTGERVEIEQEMCQAQALSVNTRSYSEALQFQKGEEHTPPENYLEFKLMLGTFCAWLFALYRHRSDLFIKNFALYQVLTSEAVARKAHQFLPLFCRQATWAILEDARFFLSQRLHPNVFAPGFEQRGPISYPYSLLNDVCTAIFHQSSILLERPSFPEEWRVKQRGFDMRTQPPTMPGVPNPFRQLSQQQQQQQQLQQQVDAQQRELQQGGSPGSPPPRKKPAMRKEDVDDRIRTLMEKYLDKFGGVMMKKVLEAANKTYEDLPTLPKYMKDGKSDLCYNYILGKCTGKFCRHPDGHAPKSDLTPEFVTALCQLVEPGIKWVMANEQPHWGKRKRNG